MINETHQDSESPRSGRRRWRLGTVALVIAVALALGLQIYSGIRTRVEAETNLQRVTDQAAVAVVDIVHPQVGAPTQEVILPGNMQAFTDTPIYARTSGYLQRWHVDIGARVKQGDLLAEIDTPEIDHQLRQARADLETAQAKLNPAQITPDRGHFLPNRAA